MKWLAVVLLLAACGPKVEEVIEKRRAGAEAKLKEYSEAVHAAINNPLEKPPVLTDKLDLDGTDMLIHAEWVDGEHAACSIAFEINLWIDTRDYLHGASPVSGMAGTTMERMFDDFEGKKRFVVIETLSCSKGAASADGTFAGGGFHGRLHFVDVAKKSSLGVIPIESGSSGEISAHVGHEDKAVESDAWSHSREAVEKALAPYLATGKKAFP
jgi:hypothetical protein